MTQTWDSPDGGGITGYHILRRRPQEGEKTLLVYVADTGSTDTTWTDRNVTICTKHAYRVKAINAAGLGRMSFYATAPPATPPDTSSATGTPSMGETLTADTPGIPDADGLDNATFSCQWLSDNADISGATSSAYTLAAAEEG